MAGPAIPVDAPGVTSPFGMLRYAHEYLEAARAVRATAGEKLHGPQYMLIGQSIELSLKAFLLARGKSARELKFKPYGHDLVSLLEAAKRLRICRLVRLMEFDEDTIRTLATSYGNHEFRYIVTGTRTVPQWGFVVRAAFELTDGLHDWLLRRRIGKQAAIQRIAMRGRF